MAKFHVYGIVRASTYIGEYEAESAEEAIELAEADAHVSFCHQCSEQAEDPDVTDLAAEPA